MGAGDDIELLERESALRELADLVGRVGRGEGGALVIESAAGSGKTALVRAAAEIATRQGVSVLRARGSELEREFACGLVRQLFERVLIRAAPARRRELLEGPARNGASVLGIELGDERAPRSAESVVHGLYWLAVNLCQAEPLLLILDDVQWADEFSWRWLRYLARRLDGLSLGLLIAGRSETASADDHRPAEIARDRDELPLELPPLSPPAVLRLVRAHSGEEPELTFVHACHALTGGNPFLVIELLRAVAAHVLPPVAASVEELGGLSLDGVGWSVRARIARLEAPATRVAETLAVLEEGSLPEVASLAGISTKEAADGIDALVAAHLIGPDQPFAFVHPVVRKVVYDQIPPARRSVSHRAAAELIAALDGPQDRVAVHLLQVPPGAEVWVAEALLKSARRAAAQAAPSTVVTYLTRAMQEQVPTPLRAQVVSELGLAEEKLRRPESIEHLSQAIELIRDGGAEAVSVVRALGRALSLEGRVAEGVEVLTRGIDRLGSERPDLAWALEMDIQAWGRAASETVEATNARLVRLIEQAQQDPDLNRRVEQFMVLGPPWQATDWRETERRANQSLDGVRNPFEADPEVLDHYQTVQALGWCDLYDQALGLVELAFEAATANASVTGHVLASTYRADVHLRRGSFAEAEADARAALELIDDRRLEIPAALSFAWLVMALVERDKASEAWEALREGGFDEKIPEQGIFGFLYGARALLHLVGHEPRRALDDALRAGQLFSTIGPGPSPSPWRSTAALAAHALRREAQARELAAEDLELARRFGAPRALGIALRTEALAGQGDPLAGLRESVAVLAPSGAQAELARSLVELGSAMRRRRHSAGETRAVLRDALDASHRCGAVVIERRARDELLAAGGRPRRASTRGLDALTPRELRVAQLAAAGSTNRQIAQALFVTPRTIEHHLRSIYTKLGITSRDGLPEALGGSPVGKVEGRIDRWVANPR